MNKVTIKEAMRVKSKPRTQEVNPTLYSYFLTNIPSPTELAGYWPST